MQIYNNPFDNKTNRNNVRSNQTLARGLQSLSKNNTANNIKQAVSTLAKGQVIKGLVLNVSNKQVVLEMENGEKLNATVKEAVDLNIGEQLYFEVKDESSNQIQLRPLTDPNINPQNATLEKVLNSNGLMLNEKNLSIVSELMDQGMNLDDTTIRTIIRNSTKFPDASIKSLVLMEKLQLPVNETTISQLKEYEEGNGMILKQTEDFIQQFCEELQYCKDSKGFEEVSQKLNLIMNNENSSMTKELEVLQKINQVVKEAVASDVDNTQVIQKIQQVIQEEYSGKVEDTKGKTVVQDEGSLIQKSASSAQESNVVIQQSETTTGDMDSANLNSEFSFSKESSVIQRGLQAGRMEESGIIAETMESKILDKINQILQEEYPEALNDKKSETIIQKSIKESQTENIKTINLKMTPEAKDATVLQKITQIIQEEYLGEIKDAKGESVIQKNLQAGKASNVQFSVETKETLILEKITQLIQDEFGDEVNNAKGESMVQKELPENSTQSLQNEHIQMSTETKEIQAIQKINRLIKEEYLGEVKEVNDESVPQKETQSSQTHNLQQKDIIPQKFKDTEIMKSSDIIQEEPKMQNPELMQKTSKVVQEESKNQNPELMQKTSKVVQEGPKMQNSELMQKTSKVVQEESKNQNLELMTKINKIIQDENLGSLKEARILQKLTEAVRNIEVQSNQNEPTKGTLLTIKLNQMILKENPTQNKESQIIQKFEQVIREENLGVVKENQLLQKLADVVKNQPADIMMNQTENPGVSKEVQLIQKINQLIQIETESLGVLQESNVDSLVQSIKQILQEASIDGNLNENSLNQDIEKEGSMPNVSQELKQSILFEEFDTNKIIRQNSSKTVEYVLSNTGTFQEALDSFLNIANHPLMKGKLNQESLQQITDIYASNLPKEEMLSQIEQVLIQSSDLMDDNTSSMFQDSPKQTAQKLVEFMDQIDLSKDLIKESDSKTALNSGFLSNKTMSQTSNLNQGQNLSNNGNIYQNQNLKPNGSSNQNQVLSMSASGLSAKLESELSSLRNFLQSKDFNDIVKGALQERWYAEPEDLKDDFKVKEQIRKIGNDLNQISQLFEKEGGFQKSAELSNQIKDNIDFMNQVNQYYNYVQIPLKLTEQLTNSELYVYTNKKNLKNNDGQISVLLHLDMKNLGSTDIHVSLTNQSIHTRFYLEEEDSLNILETYINELETAIQKLGYTMSYEMNVRQQMPSFSENLLEEKPKADIKRYNFDVRM